MYTHDLAERPVERHPVILDLEDRLRTREFSEAAIRFLCKHLLFAYPRTLWVQWSVDVREPSAAEEIAERHSLDPEKTGKFLSEWLMEKLEIRNIVFDLTDVTIFDPDKLGGLFAATTADADGEKYYVCSGEIASSLEGIPGIDPKAIRPTERAMLNLLRDVPVAQRCVVPLPEAVDLRSLDRALKKYASDRKIHDRDAVALDFKAVTEIEFDAHCMLSPIIHSLAHRYGVLATAWNANKKVIADIKKHGSLRPMRSYLVQTPQEYLWRDEPPASHRRPGSPGPLALHTFTYHEREEIHNLWMPILEGMIKFHASWFACVGATGKRFKDEEASRMKSTTHWLKGIIKELVDNVLYHAGGVGKGGIREIALGYIAMEVDTLPTEGLHVYVGDTGVGLEKGLARNYKMKQPPTEAEAVAMAMSLGELLDQREPSEDPFGGRGLEHAGALLRRLKGRICIRTGGAMACFAPEKGRKAIRTRTNMYPVQGTHVHIRIPSKWKSL